MVRRFSFPIPCTRKQFEVPTFPLHAAHSPVDAPPLPRSLASPVIISFCCCFCACPDGGRSFTPTDTPPLLCAGPELPNPKKAAATGPAIQAIYAALSAPSAVTPVLICTGALTNAALLFSVYPELVGKVRVAIMGGALGVGNTGPVAEFNLQLDPEAASVVFNCGVELAMVPLEVTHTALVTQPVLDRIGDGTEFRRLVKELLLFFRDSYKSHFEFDDPPLHDPCAVACALPPQPPFAAQLLSLQNCPLLLRNYNRARRRGLPLSRVVFSATALHLCRYVFAPQIFTAKKYRVDVEYTSRLSYGQSVVDVWAHSGAGWKHMWSRTAHGGNSALACDVGINDANGVALSVPAARPLLVCREETERDCRAQDGCSRILGAFRANHARLRPRHHRLAGVDQSRAARTNAC